MEEGSDGVRAGNAFVVAVLQYSNTPLLQFFGTPILQLPRSDDEGYMLRAEFVLRRKPAHVTSNDHH
jgi:hypothetical protein